MKMQCLIIDDEPLARKGMCEYVQDTPYLHLAGSLENALQADDFLAANPVDLILLDIRMPKLTGIEFLKNLKNPPMVIFTTAYPQYALESYDLQVMDYLVKPISPERFTRAVQKALDYFLLKQQHAPGYFFVRCDHKQEKINFKDVLFVEAMQNYCIIHTPARKFICYITLTAVIAQLPSDRFMKVHKSFVVALEKVDGIEASMLRIDTHHIPVSRSLKAEVMKLLEKNSLKR